MDRSTWPAVLTVLAADPPNNNLLTHSPLVLHNQIPSIQVTMGCRKDPGRAPAKGVKLQGP